MDARLFGSAKPATVGRYTLRRVIGTGGSGLVYVAHDPQLRREVALKLWSTPCLAAVGVTALLHEAPTLARVRHPNVVAVHDVGVLDDESGPPRAFIVMDLVRGRTLEAWSGSARPTRAVVAVLLAVARGLHAAHRAGVVHRDVTPANIIVDEDGTPFLVDFGLSTSRPDPSPAGTPGFVAPEVVAGAPADALSDQYSFGRVALEVLQRTRARPPRWLVRIVARAAAKRPSERWPSLEHLHRMVVRRQQRRRLAIGASMAGLLAATAVLLRREPDIGCDTTPWTSEVRATVATPTGDGPLDHGPASRWAVQRLDAYASVWAAACTVARSDGDAVAQACLQQRRSELGATLEVLTSEPRPASTQTMELVGALRPVDRCGGEGPGNAAPPLSPELMRAELARRVGRYDQSIAIAQRVREAASARGNGLEEVNASYHIAEVLIERGTHEEAERLLLETLWRAQTLGSDQLVAIVSTSLAFLELRQRPSSEQAQRWIDVAQESIERLGDPPWLVARIHQIQGKHAYAAGDYVAAAQDARAAIALLEPLVGRAHLTPLGAHADLGVALFMQGRNSEALEEFDIVHDVELAALGADHPIVARSLTKRAAALASMGEHDTAVQLYRRALAIFGKSAADNPDVRSTTHLGLAWALIDEERLDEAHTHARQAVALAHGLPVTQAVAWGVVGQVLRQLLRPADAVSAFERNLEFWDAHNRLHPNAAVTRLGLGLTLLDIGRPAEAVDPLKVAIEALTVSHSDPEPLAAAQFGLARAVWQSGGNRVEARALAARAKHGYLERCEEPCDGWRDVDAWLVATADAVL